MENVGELVSRWIDKNVVNIPNPKAHDEIAQDLIESIIRFTLTEKEKEFTEYLRT